MASAAVERMAERRVLKPQRLQRTWKHGSVEGESGVVRKAWDWKSGSRF